MPAAAGPAPLPSHTALGEESGLVSSAFTALRTAHDPALALKLLAEYRAKFPHGLLLAEASLATVEAHRATGHTAEALAALQSMGNGRGNEFAVLRAELNAELGHCELARAELKGLALSGALLERGLFTDATCALRLGARDEAVSALKQLPGSERAKNLLEKLQ